MTGIARKILIYAAVDGLIIQPLAHRQRPSDAVHISYGDCSILPITTDSSHVDPASPRLEAYGIIGLLTIHPSSFLISITRREQVAQVKGHPIYVVTEIAITPLSTRQEAESSISQTQQSLRLRTPHTDGTDDSDYSTDEDSLGASASGTDEVEDFRASSERTHTPSMDGVKATQHKRQISQDVIARKGAYGRFAKGWFSKEKWRVDQLRNLGLSATESDSDLESALKSQTASDQKSEAADTDGPIRAQGESKEIPAQNAAQNAAGNLLPKLLKTTRMLFATSRSFYFSYEYDITRNLASPSPRSKVLPLHAKVDPLFFWNRSLIQPFISSRQDSLVLPLMQGFIGQQRFSISESGVVAPPTLAKSDVVDKSIAPSKKDPSIQQEEENTSCNRDFLLTLISRRSVKRAGLRYLRRGVDDEGNVANSVETEQLLSEVSRCYSFSQIRGSIPIFFSQSPYSFKPVPQIQQSAEKNYASFEKHFRGLEDRYGGVAITSLVEKHGNEAVVGEKYEHNLARLNEADGINGCHIASSFWDFHSETRGMKFENVTTLMDILGTTLDGFGYSVESSESLEKRQTGILRTNCMDCLDRTNIVQSAAARRALEIQLKAEGINLDQTAMQWFNTLWADNGDAISKQYASTAAMKGDFTRTRKRNLQGALTDAGLSISRFYSGIVNDFFLQTSIDFLVGNVTSAVFDEFEQNMMSRDPGVDVDKIREGAIDLSQKLVIENEREEFILGWTVLFPRHPNTMKSMPFEESVLLLTDAALYACRFDWNLEKVSSFERVSLNHVIHIRLGTYITSTLSSNEANEARNVGFVITFEAGMDDIARVNTRSLSTSMEQSDPKTPVAGGTPMTPSSRILAAKVLPARSAVVEGSDTPRLSELEQVRTICGEIERLVLKGRPTDAGAENKSIIEEKDVIGLSDAKKSTGFMEQLGYSIKKMVWA